MNLLVLLLPSSRLKNLLLRWLGHVIADDAGIGIVLVRGGTRFSLGSEARISSLNYFVNVRSVDVGARATVGSFNQFTSNPAFYDYSPLHGVLSMGADSFITNRHLLDVSGGVFIGSFSSLAGVGSVLQTHSIDFEHNAQSALPIVIAERTSVSSRCTVLMGSEIPPRSLIAANACVLPAHLTTSGLYAGTPAKWLRPVAGEWFDRPVGHTGDIIDASTGAIHPNVF